MAQLDDRLIELENAIISAFPARLQKDPHSKIQFREGINNIGQETIMFSIKTTKGIIAEFACSLDGKKFLLKCITFRTQEEFKKVKEIIKYLDKNI